MREWEGERDRKRDLGGDVERARERDRERKRERKIARERDKTRDSGSEDERARARERERAVGRVGLNGVYMIAGIIGRAQKSYPKVFKEHAINFSRCYRLRMESHFVLDLTRSHL